MSGISVRISSRQSDIWLRSMIATKTDDRATRTVSQGRN